MDMESFSSLEKLIRPYAINILLTGFIVIIVFFIRFVVLKSITSKTKKNQEISWNKRSYYLSSMITLVILFIIWLPHLTTFFTLFSIFGTGIIIVLKEVLLNIAGWFYLIIRRPFEIGNRISIKEFSGDVIDIRLLEFSMIEVTPVNEGGQSTGRIIRVPNSIVFLNPMVNSSKEFSLCWNEIKLKISKDSNWKKASRMLETLSNDHLEHIYDSDSRLESAEKKYSIKYNKIDPKVYISYAEESILLTLRHLSEPKKTRDISDQLWRAILEKFSKENDIHLI